MIREEDMNNLSAPTPLEVRKYRVGNTFDWDNKINYNAMKENLCEK